MQGAKVVLQFSGILAGAGLWLWMNRWLKWPIHPVFALVWVASFLHLSTSSMRSERPEAIVLWTDAIIVTAGIVYLGFRLVK